MASRVLSSATSSMPPIAIDLTRYRRKLAEVCELGKADVESLRSHDGEQLRLDQYLKVAGKQKATRKQRASSCTHSANHDAITGSRGHSVPRVANNSEKVEIGEHLGNRGDDNMKSSWEPSVSGYGDAMNESEPLVSAKIGVRTSSHFRGRGRGRGRGRRSMLRVGASKEGPSVRSTFDGQDSSDVVTKSLTPSSLRRTLGMRLTVSTPFSERRLSIPRRQYSPEPVKKPRLSLGMRKTVEIIRLSDLTEKLALLERQEFSLPEDFITYHRERISPASEENRSSQVSNHEPVEEEQPVLRGGSGMRTRATDLGDKSTSAAPVSSSTPDDSARPKRTSQSSLRAQKEMSALGGVSAGLSVKRKRGRPRKHPLELSTDADSFLDSTLDASVFDEHSEDEPALKIDESVVQMDDPFVQNVEKSASVDAVAGSSNGAELPNTSIGEQLDISTKSEKDGSLDFFGSENRIMEEDFDEESNHRLCIAETEEDSAMDMGKSGVDDENLLNGGEEPTLGISEKVGADLPDSTLDISETKEDETAVREVLEGILSRLCGTTTRAPPENFGLIMEPLRRPQERRRVPPLRIRLPKHREVRKRIPARSRDYSPPVRPARPRFDRFLSVPQKNVAKEEESPSAPKSSRRSSRLAKASVTSEGDDSVFVKQPGRRTRPSAVKGRKLSVPTPPIMYEDEVEKSVDSVADVSKQTKETAQPEVEVVVKEPEPLSSSPAPHPAALYSRLVEAVAEKVLASFDDAVKNHLEKEVIASVVADYAKSITPENIEPLRLTEDMKEITELLKEEISKITGIHIQTQEDAVSKMETSAVVNTTPDSLISPTFSTVSESSSGRPVRQKKSYRELYPSLFKARRKKLEDGTPVVRKSRRSRDIRSDRKSVVIDTVPDENAETVQAPQPAEKPLENVDMNAGMQTRSRKSSHHSVDSEARAKAIIKETVKDGGEEIGYRLRSGSLTVAKRRDKRRRTSEGPMLGPKTSVGSDGALKVEIREEGLESGVGLTISPRRRRSKVEEASARNKSGEIPDGDSVATVVPVTRPSKRGKKGSAAALKAVETSDLQNVDGVAPEENGAQPSRKKSKRSVQAVAELSNEGASLKKSFMPYFKRIGQRRKLNPLAIGLKSRSEDVDQTIFYRELLLRGKELRKAESEEELDVDGLIPPISDEEVGFTNPAADVASAIDRIMPRETMVDEGGDSVEMNANMILEMASRETQERLDLLADMLSIILAQYTAEMTANNINGGSSVEYSTMIMNARRFRDKIFTFSEERRANAQWAHKALIKQLPLAILATYINLLRYCKSLARYLVDILLKEQPDDDLVNSANRLIMGFMNCKVLDPQTAAITKTLGKRRLDSVCLIAVDPYFAHLDYTPRIKAHEYIFKVLLPSSFGRVEQLRPCLPSSVDFSAAEVVEYLIDAVSKRVNELHKKYPGKKIVLAGWGTSCYINHEVVQTIPNVHAILDFAFPLKTVEGIRGDSDDSLLLTYCPSLFIVGEQALDCDVVEIQKLASKMKAFSGVIVVGAANSNLQISPLRLTIERFTQKTVHRALIDDVIDFLERHCLQAPADMQLEPAELAETNNADLSVMRGATTSSRYIPKSRRQSDAGMISDSSRKRPSIIRDSSHESDVVFKRPRATDVIQADQSHYLQGASAIQVDTSSGGDLSRPSQTSSCSAPLGMKSLADETLDNLMSPL